MYLYSTVGRFCSKMLRIFKSFGIVKNVQLLKRQTLSSDFKYTVSRLFSLSRLVAKYAVLADVVHGSLCIFYSNRISNWKQYTIAILL